MATYVISDIHGEYGKFMELLDIIHFSDEDTLYVLGDVVDRGKNPVKTLLWMMEMPNVIPIAGNHEQMMLECMSVLIKEVKDENSIKEFADKFSDDMFQKLYAWQRNGGIATTDELSKLDNETRKDVLDYVHGGDSGRGVLDKIMHLQEQYGNDKVMALMGNHEDMVVGGECTIDSMYGGMQWYDNENADDLYISWLSSLPRYYTEGNTIFVHAGIDETVGDMWEWETSDDIYTSKYPAETGRIEGLDMKVVAGHVYTSEISGDSSFNDIYYDGENHIYIDGDVLSTGVIPVLMVDTDTDSYYRITDGGCWSLTEYEE